jgi:hypothetical protein
MASFATCPDLAVKTLVPEGEDGEETTLSALRGDKAMVIDFWTTKCTRCPAALTKLNGEAGLAENDDVVFLSCALSQGDGNYEVAADLVCDGSFDALTHVFMDVAVKETAKSAFGFTSVPFYVVVGKVRGRVGVGTASVTLLCSAHVWHLHHFPFNVQGGLVLGAGEPKAVDYRALIDATVASENDPVVASAASNASASNTATAAATTAAPVPEKAVALRQVGGLTFDDDF